MLSGARMSIGSLPLLFFFVILGVLIYDANSRWTGHGVMDDEGLRVRGAIRDR
jgi:hypothetical protein